jgi:hypothetical protein
MGCTQSSSASSSGNNTNCKNCKNCSNCTDCTGKHDVFAFYLNPTLPSFLRFLSLSPVLLVHGTERLDCTSCSNCNSCFSCERCSNSNSCYNSKRCSNCHGNDDCSDCRNSSNCKGCERCSNCRDCISMDLSLPLSSAPDVVSCNKTPKFCGVVVETSPWPLFTSLNALGCQTDHIITQFEYFYPCILLPSSRLTTSRLYILPELHVVRFVYLRTEQHELHRLHRRPQQHELF